MAALTETAAGGAGRKTLTANTLTSSDTFTYRPNCGQQLILSNGTAGALNPKLVGDAAPASASFPGGPIGVNLSTGYTIGSIAVGAAVIIDLDSVAQYLQGNCTITTGTGLTAYLTSDR